MHSVHVDEPRTAVSPLAHDPVLPSGDLSRLHASQAPVSILPPAPVGAAHNPHSPILVADDDPDDRFFIHRLITKTGTAQPIRLFDDGSEVVNYLGGFAGASDEVRQRAPRLLFLDLKMTGLGGFGFLQWARQQKSAIPMTIVVLSNSAEPADMAQALELGAHRYLVKYPSVQTFATIIRSVYPFVLSR